MWAVRKDGGHPMATSQTPGINGQPFGGVIIDASCAPRPVSGKIAFFLPCGGTVTARQTVAGQAQLVSNSGQIAGSPKNFRLMPGQSLTLTAPPSGQEWMVVDLTQSQADWIAAGVLGGFATAAALTTYGAVELVEHIIARRRQKKARKKFARWFWGS